MPGFHEQFATPQGWRGYVAGWLMLASNRRLAEWAINLLDLQPTDHVLEIGFGPGLAVQKLTERLWQGRVAGIDISPLMVHQASRRNAKAIQQGHVELQRASVEKLPYSDGAFDKVLSINAVQFWPDLRGNLREVCRVLRVRGTLVVVLQDRRAKSAAEVLAGRDHIVDAVTQAGFSDVASATRAMKPIPAFAVMGTKATGV